MTTQSTTGTPPVTGEGAAMPEAPDRSRAWRRDEIENEMAEALNKDLVPVEDDAAGENRDESTTAPGSMPDVGEDDFDADAKAVLDEINGQPDAVPDGGEGAEPDQPQDAEQGQAAAPGAAVEPRVVSNDDVVEVKINGKVVHRRIGDVIDHVMIGEATRDRLDSAKRLEQEYRRRLDEFDRQSTGGAPAPAGHPHLPQDHGLDVRAVARSLTEGDEEEVVAALQQMLSRQPDITPSAVEARVRTVLTQQRDQEAIAAWSADVQEILTDPQIGDDFQSLVQVRTRKGMEADLLAAGVDPADLSVLSDQYIATYHRDLRAAGAARDFHAILGEATVHARHVLGRPPATAAASAAPKPGSLQDRAAAKRAAPSVPSAASGGKVNAGPPEPVIPSIDDIIAEEKRARGLLR